MTHLRPADQSVIVVGSTAGAVIAGASVLSEGGGVAMTCGRCGGVSTLTAAC